MTTTTATAEHIEVKGTALLKVRGLSLTRPWPWAFVNGPFPKRIENRSWPPPRSITSTHHIALHAAKSWDEADREFIEDVTGIAVPPRNEHLHSAIFAVCRIPAFIDDSWDVIDEAHGLAADQQRWFFGPYGWIVSDFVSLITPVACVGALGLWGFENKQSQLEELRRVYKLSIEAGTGHHL